MADDDESRASDIDEKSCVDSSGEVDGEMDESDQKDAEESPSESDSGSDDCSTSGSDSDRDDDSEREKPNDGISDYERLRLERIKRNQQRLAALGLQDGALKPKPQKSNRRKSIERKASLEPTRKQSSRASKKRVDYSEQTKLHTLLSRESKSKQNSNPNLSLSTSPTKELTPEELKRREKRRKERRREERIPRFIYDEFQRIRSKRNQGLKKAKRLFTKAEREKNHWTKMTRKLESQQQKQEAVVEKEAQKRQKAKEMLLEEQVERTELDCKGMTKKELIREIEQRTPELLAILAGHKKEQTATLKKLKQEAKEKEALRKRQSLERRLTAIDALDRYPKAMNEALTKLNTLLYSRAPKDSLPSRHSAKRKHESVFDSVQSNPSSSVTKTKEQTEPRKKKKKLDRDQLPKIDGDAITKASAKKKNVTSTKRGGGKKKSQSAVSTTAADKPMNSSNTQDIDSAGFMKTKANSSAATTKTKRGRSSMPLSMHSNESILPKVESAILKKSRSDMEKVSVGSAKRQKKPRDARFVGGWISPKFSKELDRSWLERTKPIDNRPVVLVPDDVAKLAGVSAKKTAVFDLRSYVPQAGDIILYYPSAHSDVLNVFPDTLGSRQRNLLRVPLWARASRDRNRYNKEVANETMWWTDEWIESLATRIKSKQAKQYDLQTKDQPRVESTKFAQNSNEPTRKASLGDYPIICRVEKTHVEFPEDPYAKEKKRTKSTPKEEAIGSSDNSDGTGNNKKVASEKRLSLSAEAGKNKLSSHTSPQIRLAVMLKPLSPIIPPFTHGGTENGGMLGLPPRFTVVTFPVDKPLEPFIIPFCWAYTSFHSLKASEKVWIHGPSCLGEEDGKSKLDCEGKAKIIDFIVAATIKPSKATVESRDTNGKELKISHEQSSKGLKYSSVLSNHMHDLKVLVAALTKDGTIQNEVVAASLVSEKQNGGTIPIREANIIVEFLSKYFQQSEQKIHGAEDPVPLQSLSTGTLTTISRPSLVTFILRTLPIRQGVLVAYDSNRRQQYRASPWNLVSLQPTELSSSIQDGLLGYLEYASREKAALCLNDFIKNNSRAKMFVPMITESIAPAYYSAVPVGMSLGRILARLKTNGNKGSCYYTSLESILVDMNLILENCLLYNNPESEVVSNGRDIITQCLTLIKDIIRNQNPQDPPNISENQARRKNQVASISSFLNAPYNGNLNWEWLQRLTPLIADTRRETVTRRATASTWIPQCGESVLYSNLNHFAFVKFYQECLDEFQSSVPSLKQAGTEKRNQNIDETQRGTTGNDLFPNMISTHWLEGTVMSVRSSFPRSTTKDNATPLLIVELRLHYDQCEEHIVVCWRPSFEGMKRNGSGLALDSFLRPSWMTTGDMKIFPSTQLKDRITSPISEEMSLSITKCFDFLKKRCIDGILPETVNPDVTLEKAEHGIASTFDSQYLPSFPEFFAAAQMKYGTRGIKKAGYNSALQVLSEVGYMPLWGNEMQQNSNEQNKKRHESWMPFPSLCLELIRLRISNGYYNHLEAIVNDVSESYVETVLFLLSGPYTRESDRISIRKIAKYLSSPKGNGKMSRIATKKKTKKQKIFGTQPVKDKCTNSPQKKSKLSKESPLDIFSKEEEDLIQQIIQIRRYHAAAIVFALEASHVEKIFCLTSTSTSSPVPDALPEIDPSRSTSLTPDQLDAVAKIRELLHAIRRDPCRNQINFPDRDIYKIRIRCGERFIAENGEFDITAHGSMFFEPNKMIASLPNGSRMTVTVKCGNKDASGEKKIVATTMHTGLMESPATKFYALSEVGRTHFSFNSADVKDNEGLLCTLFGSPGRMQSCIRCQSMGASFYSCRVLRQHSNPDYDLTKNFKGTSGVDCLLSPWNYDNEDCGNDRELTESVENEDDCISELQTSVEKENQEVQNKERLNELVEKVTEARLNMKKSNEIQKLASYLYTQAGLLSDLEVKLSEDFISTTFPLDPADNHYVFCIHCGCAGDLLICDGCPNVSHAKCSGLECVPDGDWFCHKCTVSTTKSHIAESSEGEQLESLEIAKTKQDERKIPPSAIKEISATGPPGAVSSSKQKASVSEIQDDNTNKNIIENLEEETRTVGPEINDGEFDEIELQLTELLKSLISDRLPQKTQLIEQETQERDFLDVLGNSQVREFLSFIGIESAEALLSTKTGLIAIDLKMWRKEKGLKPLSSMGYGTTVSGWKASVRKAIAMESNEGSQKKQDARRRLSTKSIANGLEVLPAQGLRFCSYLQISDGDAFLAMRTTDLAKNYASWRKKEKMPKLAGDGASAYISTWKTKIRKTVPSSSAKPAIDERRRAIRKGFKVRKLFDDGNYYEGQVISGPSEAFDEEKGETVLCWRVKYVDDDEEEFTIDELNQWRVQKLAADSFSESTTDVSNEIKPRSIVKREEPEASDDKKQRNERPREGRRRSSRVVRS